jgi:S1-C subfamily serine protease
VKAGAEVLYVAPNTPADDELMEAGLKIKAVNGAVPTGAAGTLITVLQDMLFTLRPGELVTVETGDGVKRLLRTELRPDLPLLKASEADTTERLTAPFYGMILESAGKSVFVKYYVVKKVFRGSVADEAGIQELDPITIRNFQILKKEGFSLLDVTVKKRSMGYLETTLRLPSLLDSPDTL